MEDILFNGPAGRLEGCYHQAEQAGAPIALVLHPNPQLGGHMNNKVVYAIFQAFVKMGFSVLRFNFRGIGKSEGIYTGDIANEIADTLAALDWVKKMNPEAAQCWMSGHSFGAVVGAHVMMRRPDITGFVFVAPPANVCDFSFMNPCPASGLIVQGALDTVVLENSVAMLAERLNMTRRVQVDYVVLPKADHIYTNCLKELFSAIITHVPELIRLRGKPTTKKHKPVSAK